MAPARGSKSPTTSDPTRQFFEELAARDHEPLLARARGTIRFDLADKGNVETWFVTVDHGHISVSRRRGKADALLAGDKGLFDAIVAGRENAMAALLRGAYRPEGDLTLLLNFQRLFPGPPANDQTLEAGYARRMG
jgi:predicted lipid carrier protein YhbT